MNKADIALLFFILVVIGTVIYSTNSNKNTTSRTIHLVIDQCIQDPNVQYIEIVTNKSSAKFQVR